MGEKILVIKARFPGADRDKRREVRELFDECYFSVQFWQKLRSTDPLSMVNGTLDIWPMFKWRFPKAFAFLEWRGKNPRPGDLYRLRSYRPGNLANLTFDAPPPWSPDRDLEPVNGLAGILSWADACDQRTFRWSGERFTYRSEVWSGAEEGMIDRYLAAAFGAALPFPVG